MEYLVALLLTIATSFAILKIVKRNEKIFLGRPIYRQSDMHNLLKSFFSRNAFYEKKSSQMIKRTAENTISIVAVDNKAYWVVDNVFYVADFVDGKPDLSTANPVDTSEMSNSDIDKMLFILDNLGRGDSDERGSTGNK